MGTIETAQAELQQQAWRLYQVSERIIDRQVMREIDKSLESAQRLAETIRTRLPD